MRYELWDKQTNIYDVTPEQAFVNNVNFKTQNCYLIYNDSDCLIDCIPINQVPNPNGYTSDTEIMDAYIEQLTATPEPVPSPGTADTSELTAEVEELKEQNASLTEQVTELESVVEALID